MFIDSVFDVSKEDCFCLWILYSAFLKSKEGCLRLWILLIAKGDPEREGPLILAPGSARSSVASESIFIFTKLSPQAPDCSAHWSQNLNWLDLDFFWHLAQLFRLINVFAFALWQNSWFRVFQLFNISTSVSQWFTVFHSVQKCFTVLYSVPGFATV